jgi:hypothetical protein
MMDLSTCHACAGFVPDGRTTCPHCDAPARASRAARAARLGRRLATAAASGAVMMTLMACYGGPPKCEIDEDKDRACAKGGRGTPDCNDQDPNIRPLASDPDGDGIDQNCDGVDGMKSSGAPGTAAPGTAAPGTAAPGTAAPP